MQKIVTKTILNRFKIINVIIVLFITNIYFEFCDCELDVNQYNSTKFDSEDKFNNNNNDNNNDNDINSGYLPDWLLNITKKSKISKSRQKRRFISFPQNSYMFVYSILSLSIKGLSDTSSLDISSRLFFLLPNSNPYLYFLSPSSRSERSYQVLERLQIYQFLEEFLDSMDFNGKDCVLRTICEINEIPFDHGIIGDLVNRIFTFQKGPNVTTSSEYEDYLKAEETGHLKGQCQTQYNTCQTSVINLFSQTMSWFW